MSPKEAIAQFKKLYAKNYGIELSDEEAARRFHNLTALYQTVYCSDSFGRIENESNNPDTNSP